MAAGWTAAWSAGGADPGGAGAARVSPVGCLRLWPCRRRPDSGAAAQGGRQARRPQSGERTCPARPFVSVATSCASLPRAVEPLRLCGAESVAAGGPFPAVPPSPPSRGRCTGSTCRERRWGLCLPAAAAGSRGERQA